MEKNKLKTLLINYILFYFILFTFFELKELNSSIS